MGNRQIIGRLLGADYRTTDNQPVPYRCISNPYPVKEGQRYINWNPGHLFAQQPAKKAPKTGGDNYHAARQN